MSAELRVEVQRASRAPGAPTAGEFRSWARAAAGAVAARLCLRVVDEPEMAALNERYRRRSGATDVLAFPADETERAHGLLGDLAICAPVVLRLAAAARAPAAARFAHVTVHGVLHLLGHDHAEPAARARMQAAERAALARLGYPDPYGAAP